MKQELSDQLRNMCDSWQISPGIECMILELMHDAYHDGWQDGVAEMTDSNMPL